MVQGQASAPLQSGTPDFINYKNRITTSVMNKIGELERAGGITVPKNFNVGNQLNLAMLKLSSMKDRDDNFILPTVTPQSVANALLNMCILGLSLEKGQCAFIKYKDELQFQVEYHGRIALAKRLGGAGDPQAQVIYEGDVFEYEINPRTGKKVIIKHEQKLENVDNAKIVGAWAIVPYADHPEIDPKVEIMTIAEIRQAWMQGATKGQSPAHRNFTQEMCKKTVIGRACKLFVSTSDDAGIYESYDRAEPADYQPQEEVRGANATEAVFEAIPAAPPKASDLERAGEPVPAPEPVHVDAAPQAQEKALDENFFNV